MNTIINQIKLATIPTVNLEQNKIEQVNAEEARSLCGCPDGGLYFPYFDINRKPIFDPDGQPFGRLLTDDGEWHQRPCTGIHVFVPRRWWLEDKLRILTLVVGEPNALAMAEIGDLDALTYRDGSCDIYRSAVLGLTNVFGFHQAQKADETGFTLVPELSEAIAICKPNRVVLAGDRFSNLDPDFAIAATRLKSLLPGCKVAVFPYAVNEPATMVDCLAAMGQGFEFWSGHRLDN